MRQLLAVVVATTRQQAIRFWRLVRRLVRAQGAGESGLAQLIDLHAVSSVGDALVAVALAGTLFFSVPVGEARPRVAAYLLVTMAPFAVLAPVVGPTLDRFPHGRRYALATTLLVRAFLAYVMAGAVHQVWLYPAAFGCLVMSKAYGVARSAAVPRLLPAQVSLVAANARLSLAAIVPSVLVVPIGLGLAMLGTSWTLWFAALWYVVGMVLALRLPGRADSDAGERPARFLPVALPGRGSPVVLGHQVVVALRSAAALRGLSGFLTLYLAFLLRSTPHRVGDPVALGLVVAAAALGGFAGTTAGARLRLARPHALQLVLLALAAAGCLAAAVAYSLGTAAVVAFLTGFTAGLAKLALDSVIQSEVPEPVRASAFARSETLLQLAWVVGGGLGLVPFGGWPGFALAAGILAAVAVRTGLSMRTMRALRHPAVLP